MKQFSNIRVGSKLTGVSCHYFDNYRVVAIGDNWAVLENEEDYNSRVFLEPSDDYIFGSHEYDEVKEQLVIKKSTGYVACCGGEHLG